MERKKKSLREEEREREREMKEYSGDVEMTGTRVRQERSPDHRLQGGTYS